MRRPTRWLTGLLLALCTQALAQNGRSGGETMATATPIPVTPGGTWTDSGSTASAVNDYDSAVAALFCQTDTHSAVSFGSRDLFYAFTLDQSTTVGVDLCTTTNWNCVVGIVRADGVLLSANNDNATLCAPSTTRSTIAGCCLSPGTYFVVVDGYGSTAAGPYTLSVSFSGESCESLCDRYAAATLSLAAPGTVIGSTVGGAQVYGSAAGEQGVDIAIPYAGEWNFDTCDAATAYAADLYLFTAPPCEGGTLMASNTGGTCASMASAGRLLNVGLQPGLYHLVVSHTALVEGAYGLSVYESTPPRVTQGGPDAFGYMWVNSLNAAGPAAAWVDISQVGTPVNFASGASTVGPLPLGMDFPFYDSLHSQCYLSSEGFLAFEPLANSYPANATIPGAALPNSLVAGFWDDLTITAGISQAFTWWDAAGQRFIVQYQRFLKTAEEISFQIILEADGDVLVQYLSMPEQLLNSASVGLEDTGGTRGLQVNLNNVGGALYEGVAIRFIRPVDLVGPTVAHTPLPDTALAGPWTVNARVHDPSGVVSATLSHRLEAGTWSTLPMSLVGDSLWTASIPNGQGTVEYYVTAIDGATPPRTTTSPTWSFVARPTSGGPDSFGYRWVSSRDAAGPAVDWVDISAVGTSVAIANNSQSALLPMGLSFPLYEASFSSCVLSSEGFITFAPYSGFQSINFSFPYAGLPHSIIAPFWDDLGYTAGTSQLLCWADTTGGRFVASWLNFLKGTTPLSFQIILEASGDVQVNYLDLPAGLVNSASVGLENATGTVGLTVNHNNAGALLADNLSLRLLRPTDLGSPVLTHTPLTNTESFGPWDLAVQASDPSGVASLILHYRSDSGAWSTVAGQPLGGDAWTVQLPAITGQIQYYLSATDAYTPSHTTTSPTWSFLRRHTRGGPDTFGHTWINSRDPQGPVFAWEDISTTGTPLNLAGNNTSALISLSFPFPFYNGVKSALRVGSDGQLHFSSTINYSGSGVSLPNTLAPNDLIAPFWDDLNARPASGGQVWVRDDAAGQRFIVQWRGPSADLPAGNFEFQAILHANGNILFQYLNVVEADVANATVGMENSTGTDALQVNRLNVGGVLADSLAILLYSPGPLITHTPLADTLLPGPWTVAAQITDPVGVSQATLAYSLDGGAWQSLPMSGAPPLWSATLPDLLGVVDYRISAVNVNGLSTTSPTWRFAHRPTRSAGVDSCGISWVNSVDVTGPTFTWVDISALTTPFQVSGGFQSPPMAIGFDFPFYEGLEDSFRVCGNGMIHFSAWAWELSSVHPIPSTAGADGIIAPFWDLLSPTSASYPGSIWVLSQPALGRCIVQFHTVAQGGSVYLDFQVILYASGDILFQYLNVDEADVSQATVGVEDLSGTRGLSVHDHSFGSVLQDQLAILLPFTDRLAPVITHGGVPDVGVGESVDITVGLVDYASGVAAAELRYQLNGGAEQTVPLVPGLDPLYHATLPDMGAPGTVSYRVVAWDGATPPNERVSGVWTYEVFAFSACQTPGPANALPYAFAYATDEDFGSVVAERFGGLNGPITSLDFQGNTMALSPSTGLWSMCENGGLTALVRVLFLDLNLQPVAEVVDTLAGSLSPEVWPCGNCSGSMLGYDFHLELPTPLDLREGYLSIQGVGGANDCWFLWMCSATGVDNASLKNEGQGWTANTYADDLNYCLGVGSALPCLAPQDVQLVVAEQDVLLSWNAIPGATGYQILGAATGEGPFASLGNSATPSFVDVGALATGRRFYRVVTVCP